MNSSLELFFDEFKRKLDELEARWERRFSLPGLEQLDTTQHVEADNWGGLFEDPARVVEECDYEPAASPPPMKEEHDVVVVPDNWGGLFEQPDHTSEERGHDLTADVVFRELASSVQIRISELEAEPVRLLDFRPIPVEYALSAKPIEPEYIPASDKELKAVIAQSNADQLLTERLRVSTLDRDSLSQGALSATRPP
jgi:hypothetical protein